MTTFFDENSNYLGCAEGFIWLVRDDSLMIGTKVYTVLGKNFYLETKELKIMCELESE